LAFKRHFSGAIIKTTHNLKSAELALKENMFHVVFIDMDMEDASERISSYEYVANIVRNVLVSSSKKGHIVMLTHQKIPHDYVFPWGITRGLNKKEIFISPMAVNQITTELMVEPMSYHYSF
jgi:hypothetical protein